MGAQGPLTEEHKEMLERVKSDSPYYGPLLPADEGSRRELELLRDLEARGYVRYCPYPEEFWVAIG